MTMSADPQKARSIFLEAVEQHAPDEWGHFLDATCGTDPELRRRVEILLRAHEQTNSLLDDPGPALIQKVDESLAEGPGTVIGPYKLIEQIGEGGFGVVYMAEQAQPVRRKVALKILKPGMDTRQVIARFEVERQVLALMDHPNIAKMLDAGTIGEPGALATGVDTDKSPVANAPGSPGRPFFVMELVKGIPVTEYCDQNQIPVRDRLELFSHVCHAIQHAHQKGIIHRDLKPSNVLIARYDDKPVPKVIDFGVAKAISEPLTEQTLHTGFWAVLGTLEYMSPEQASFNQLDIDTRSDIYSLGILLYELLTGTTPLDHKRAKEAGMLEALRIIREEEAPTLTNRLGETAELTSIAARRGLEPARLTQLMSGELDWIVMKALEKDRNRRYESASALAADVVRYLNDEPVSACPPSTWYRFRKFASRNKVALFSSGLVALALVAGTAVSVWQAVRATRAKSEARQDAAIAEAVNEFLNEDLLAQAAPSKTPDRDLKLRAVLDRASERIEGRFADQPLVEARLRSTLAMTYESLDECAVAQRHAERARELYERALGAEHPDSLASMNRLARVLTSQRRYEEARQLFEEVLALRRRVLGPEHPDTLKSMSDLATVMRLQGQLVESRAIYEEAGALHNEVLGIRRRVLGQEHPDTLSSMTSLAVVLVLEERLDEARPLLESALTAQRRVLRDGHPDTLTAMHRLAHVLFRQGHFAESFKLYEEALEIQRRVLGSAHSDTLVSINNLAWMLATAPDPKLRVPARAVELAREVVQRTPSQANSWNTLGVAQYRAGNWKKAVASLEKSVELYPGVDGYNCFFLAMAHWQLGKAKNIPDREQAAHRQEARKQYDSAVIWTEKNQPKNEELIRFRAEAAELLGIKEPLPKPGLN